MGCFGQRVSPESDALAEAQQRIRVLEAQLERFKGPSSARLAMGKSSPRLKPKPPEDGGGGAGGPEDAIARATRAAATAAAKAAGESKGVMGSMAADQRWSLFGWLNALDFPAELMAEPSNPNLYDDFARVATDLNVYTGVDYAEIIEHLNEFWKIGEVTGLTPEAEEAQEHLMKLPARFNKLAQRQAKSLAKKPREPKEWAWLNGRVV